MAADSAPASNPTEGLAGLDALCDLRPDALVGLADTIEVHQGSREGIEILAHLWPSLRKL
jgi:hypothetical protein